MTCSDLDQRWEAIADGSEELSVEARDHVAGCATCRRRLADAQAIEHLLATRETVMPPAAFTAGVMLRVGHEQWRAERLVDAGFNLAIGAGVLFVLAGALGFAWAIGSLTFTIDFDELLRAASGSMATRLVSQVQTIALAAALLTTALALWWWAEADSA